MRRLKNRTIGKSLEQDPRPKERSVPDVPDERRRVAVEGVSPEVDDGRFPVKRVVGEEVVVEADAFADGHDVLRCRLLYRKSGEEDWRVTPMDPLGNDRWRGSFVAESLGSLEYTIEAGIDPFESWRRDLTKRIEARQDISVDLLIGAELVEKAAARAAEAAGMASASGSGRGRSDELASLVEWAGRLKAAASGRGGTKAPAAPASRARARERAAVEGEAAKPADAPPQVPEEPHAEIDRMIASELAPLMERHADDRFATRYDRVLAIQVERERARFSAWYEFFPRSVPLREPGGAPKPGVDAGSGDDGGAPDDDGEATRHATLRECEAFVPYIRDMGFDVVYLPPIHPIGLTERKGPNNDPIGVPGDVGSPWAIGSAEGGHHAVHPDLGTLDDFHSFRCRVEEEGMEVALDIAFQCSPDHPWVHEHPEWFRRRPDGTIQYAENPPKKYQDIYPFDFETEEWRALWEALEGVMRFWIAQGVKIFRVDNPHTKPFPFWEWAIGRIRSDHPDVIFLSEAFTRPRIMGRLAKLGFTQSYTYFTWRNAKWEIEEYVRELTEGPAREYLRPNFWPNTPDILNEYLQTGGRPAFMIRLLLAATLSGNYGIYGPAFELLEATPVREGSEEYLDSEKYQLRQWDIERADSLRHLIARVNGIRRENDALQWTNNVRLLPVDNDQILAYSKRSPDGANTLLVVVTLDPRHAQSGWLELDPHPLAIGEGREIRLHDLLGGGRYRWRGRRNFIRLDPLELPGHVFRMTVEEEGEEEEDRGARHRAKEESA